jgi:CheY-like chemotaxis protein
MATILLIEDDEQARSMLKQMLERQQHTVIEAANGNVALERLKEGAADLVITDLMMPEKDGLTAIQEILRDYPRSRVIAMSGGAGGNAAWLPIAKKAGAMRILKKPFTKEQFISAVNETLSDPWV